MKKTLVSALAATLVVGAASTTFAAANPFSDVPTDHWAYDAVAQLARDGVIEGYGDTTFQGESAITRYEMAQMIAKAMAKQDQANAADKAMIDKLAAEFSDELNNLGVRVSNLEKKMDNIYWHGWLRYHWSGQKDEGTKRNSKHLLRLRLQPEATVNDHWMVRSVLDINKENTHLSHDGETIDGNGTTVGSDKDSSFKVFAMYVSGKYGHTTYDLGRMQMYTEQGLVADSRYTGAKISYAKDKFDAYLMLGRKSNKVANNIFGNNANDKNWNRHGDLFGGEMRYKFSPTFTGRLGYYYWKDKNMKSLTSYKGDGSTYGDDNFSLWEVAGTYNLTPALSLNAIYVGNTSGSADSDLDHSYRFRLKYGNTNVKQKGSYDIYAAYSYLGNYAEIGNTYSAAVYGAKGIDVGAEWAIMHNVLFRAGYFDGEYINKNYKGGKDVNKLFFRAQIHY